MIETAQAVLAHDAVGIALFLAMAGYALALNLPREWQCVQGWALAAAVVVPAALGAAALFAQPWLLSPALFVLGLVCARR